MGDDQKYNDGRGKQKKQRLLKNNEKRRSKDKLQKKKNCKKQNCKFKTGKIKVMV